MAIDYYQQKKREFQTKIKQKNKRGVHSGSGTIVGVGDGVGGVRGEYDLKVVCSRSKARGAGVQ